MPESCLRSDIQKLKVFEPSRTQSVKFNEPVGKSSLGTLLHQVKKLSPERKVATSKRAMSDALSHLTSM